MIEEFKNLSAEETDLMLKVPVLVSILIAGADNNIDKSEIREAVNLSKIKLVKAREDLVSYYKIVGQDFEDKVKVMINQLPSGVESRTAEIVKELQKVNAILPKLDTRFALEFYESIRDMAKKIAEASGGILGYMAVGYEESKLIGLSMIKDPSVTH
ncbi:hypothetical protein [Fulvivirga ligni]|uniref:hypothetical protein n=1 Tax=Fulvivirga ligni TaxID=2904246 RepID=UPI001F449E90|nr:hypothetical protein [Fulvivirga ligni]UII20120.1 hypothetical protein LVD16_19935 [Fulvivirga ligni]